jgi:hypothetical protein
VERKQKHCSEDEATAGDCWDHTAIDPESRLVVSLVVGKRTADSVAALVRDFRDRTSGRVMRLMTSDEYAAYPEAIRAAYGRWVEPPRTGRPGRPQAPQWELPPELTYATVHKERQPGLFMTCSVAPILTFGGRVSIRASHGRFPKAHRPLSPERFSGGWRRTRVLIRSAIDGRRHVHSPAGRTPRAANSDSTE